MPLFSRSCMKELRADLAQFVAFAFLTSAMRQSGRPNKLSLVPRFDGGFFGLLINTTTQTADTQAYMLCAVCSALTADDIAATLGIPDRLHSFPVLPDLSA